VSPDAVRLIRVSWHQISTRRELMAVMFYGRLFELEPGLRDVFRDTDFHRQRAKFVAMLDLLVRSADQPDDLIREAAQLGRQHAMLNLSSRNYELAGQALLWTLDRSLGLDFTPATRAAWTELYALVASVMRRASGRISGAMATVPHLPPNESSGSFPGCT
jgi:hemoglobin-like flavoprotein